MAARAVFNFFFLMKHLSLALLLAINGYQP
jgi:hypothetical protein